MCTTKTARTTSAPQSIGTAVQLPADLFDQVQAYADAHYIDRAEAIRYLIDAGLGAEAHTMLVERRACSRGR
jgi:hypothetical protein